MPRNATLFALRQTFRRFARDERGAIFVMLAVSMTTLLMTIGLAVDVGWWYTLQRRNQSAADAAAIAAAYEVVYGRNDVATYLTPAASAAASTLRNSYTGVPQITFNNLTGLVQADLPQNQSTWFAALAGMANVSVPTRAVAQVKTLPATCMMAISPAANKAIDLQGNAGIDATGCTIVSNSNSASAFYLQGNPNITAATLITPGKVDAGGAYSLTLTSPPQTGAQSVPDPYAGALTHANLISGMPGAACTLAGNTWSGNCKVITDCPKRNPPPNCYQAGQTLSTNTQISGGLIIKGSAVDLKPGVYWVTDGDLVLGPGGGTLTCSTCVNGGAGVTIILTTAKANNGTVGALTLNSQAILTLNGRARRPPRSLTMLEWC